MKIKVHILNLKNRTHTPDPVKSSMKWTLLVTLITAATVYLDERFDEDWEMRWITSKSKDKLGEWEFVQGLEDYGHPEMKGLRTVTDAGYYAISRKLDKPLSMLQQTTVLQYTVKFDNDPDCGAAFMKLFPSSFSPVTLRGASKPF